MCKIEKVSQTEPKAMKVKCKKKIEVISQIRPNSTRTSNVAHTLKTQNMGELAARRGELHGLARVKVRLGAQQHGGTQVYEVRHVRSCLVL